MEIAITGASGLIGTALTRHLAEEGHHVVPVTRSGSHGIHWDPAANEIDAASFEGIDAVVHLAGEGIAEKRWNPGRIQELISSRTHGPKLLYAACERTGHWPKSFISSAGIGYYGAVTNDHLYTENDPPGADTIAHISSEWEKAADQWSDRTRVVKLRTPVVLAREGGALPQLAAPVRYGIGSPMGSGRQWMPWVHIDDLVHAYQQAITNDRMSGAYNVIGGNATNADLLRTLAKVLHRPFFFPNIPAFVLKAMLGELAVLLLDGSRASNERLLQSGFTFKHTGLHGTLKDLLRN